jgi:acyl carrier protein
MDLEAKLKEQIIEQLSLDDVKVEDISNDMGLFSDDGLALDSIDALELIVLFDKNYQVKLKDPEEGQAVFVSIATMADYIRSQGKG